MNKALLLSFVFLVLACKNKTTSTVDYSEETLDVTTSIYPNNITKVFDAHGGLDKWNTMKTLEFTMQKAELEADKAIACLDFLAESDYKQALISLARIAVNRDH